MIGLVLNGFLCCCSSIALILGVPKTHDEIGIKCPESVILMEKGEVEESLGGYGRLYIPEVGVDVAVYSTSECNIDYAQAVCDRQDSAAYCANFNGGHISYIADHWNQGFINIKYCQVGTEAFIKKCDGSVDEYVCVEVSEGHNTGYDLVDSNWNSIVCREEDLLCYTCNGCWQNIYTVYFNKVT